MIRIYQYDTLEQFMEACPCVDTTYCIQCDGRMKKIDEHPEDHLPVLEISQFVGDSAWLHKRCAADFANEILSHANVDKQ